MGLKGLRSAHSMSAQKSDKIRPKWDWKCTAYVSLSTRMHAIKSDQNGIESFTPGWCDVFYLNDKIRPKWDWKHNELIFVNVDIEVIKSDQNGIESPVQRRRRAPARRIKSDQNGIERNTSSSIFILFSDHISSQFLTWATKHRHQSTLFHDKIRPKWDWKDYVLFGSLLHEYLIKSDQNGIERAVLFLNLFQRIPIKSDQNGIESNFMRC